MCPIMYYFYIINIVMFSKKTKVSSQGEKIKKFKMPTFPSALVITFFVLLFVVLLSWIPHKGWVDTTNPLFYFTEEGLFGAGGVPLGTWIGPDWNNVDGGSLTLMLTEQGDALLTIFLNNFTELSSANINEIIGFLPEKNTVIVFDNINLGNDWNSVGISYAKLSFDATIKDTSYSASITFDKIFALQAIPKENGIYTEGSFTFNVLSGEITSFGNEPLEKPLYFASESIADDWFNFFDSNYYLGDEELGSFGILNIPFVLVAGFFNSTGVILYLFCIGAFVEVMLQSGALEAGTSSLVKKMKGKELLLIPILFILFCMGGTAFGMQEETLGLIPLIIPFLVLAGFDTMTGLLIIVVGTTAGISASVLDPFSVGVMSSSLTGEIIPESAEVAPNTGIVIRIIMFFAFAIIGSIFCTWYGHRSRKGKDYVAEPEVFEKNQQWAHEMLGESHSTHTGLTKRQAIGLSIFGATFVIMIFSLLPWIVWFPALEDFGTNAGHGWAKFSSFFFAGVLFGQWYFIQLSFMFLMVAFVLGWTFGMKQKDTNKAIYNGMKGMIGLGIILTVSRGVEIVLGYSGLTTDMVVMMFAGAEGGTFGAIGLAWILFPIFAFLASFISSTSGLAAITGPIIAPMLWQLSGQSTEQFMIYATVVMVTYPLAQGTINMFMPTTGLVIAQAEVAKVNFGKALPILTIAALGTAIIGMTIITTSILFL